MIGLTTASSVGAFQTSSVICEKDLGTDRSLTGFGLPIAMVLQRPSIAASYLIVLMYFYGIYHEECTVSWLIMALIISAVIAVSSPPVPGGGASVYAMLFAQAGLPSEAVAIALALDMVLDFAITAFEAYHLPLSFISIAGSLGMLDKDILRKTSAPRI